MRFPRPLVRRSTATVAFLLALIIPPADRARGAETGGRIDTTLVPAQTAFYPGDALVVKLTFTGTGADEVVIDAAALGRDAFTIKDAQGNPPGKLDSSAPAVQAGQAALSVRGFDSAERLVNLSVWYPKLTSKTGSWEISWAHGTMQARPVKAFVVKAYRPGKDLVARVETDLGTMTWEMLPAEAPQHVKNFVDLARSGFYDGLTIFRVIPGVEADGGDPKGDGTGAWTRMMPPEMSKSLKMSTGLVGAARQETSMTSDSMFFITLTPADFMQGKQTFFARLTEGWEVLAKLHPLPTRGETGFRDAWLLQQPVKIIRVSVK